MTSRTYDHIVDRRNSLLALERDSFQCVWCREVLGISSPPSTPHHIMTRRRNMKADAQITLCRTRSQPDAKGLTTGCHDRVEMAYQIDGVTEITREKLIALMFKTYGIVVEETNAVSQKANRDRGATVCAEYE